MTVSLTPPPLDEFKETAVIKLEPKPASTFTPIPCLSPSSSRKEIYAAIDSLASFHAHHSHFQPAPEWDRLYACVRSYKKSHPDIPDIATAFQHHRRQVLGILKEEERTPSIDRLRKRRDRQQQKQQSENAKKQRQATTAVVEPPVTLTADLSASVALSTFHSAPPVSESGSRCGCGAMVEANRRLQEELRRKDAQIAALQLKLTQLRQVLDGDAAAEQKDSTSTTPPPTDTRHSCSRHSAGRSVAVQRGAGSGRWCEWGERVAGVLSLVVAE